jgi:hypothetical protein
MKIWLGMLSQTHAICILTHMYLHTYRVYRHVYTNFRHLQHFHPKRLSCFVSIHYTHLRAHKRKHIVCVYIYIYITQICLYFLNITIFTIICMDNGKKVVKFPHSHTNNSYRFFFFFFFFF